MRLGRTLAFLIVGCWSLHADDAPSPVAVEVESFFHKIITDVRFSVELAEIHTQVLADIHSELVAMKAAQSQLGHSPVVLISAGGPGSGKSFVSDHLTEHTFPKNSFYDLDADKVKRMLIDKIIAHAHSRGSEIYAAARETPALKAALTGSKNFPNIPPPVYGLIQDISNRIHTEAGEMARRQQVSFVFQTTLANAVNPDTTQSSFRKMTPEQKKAVIENQKNIKASVDWFEKQIAEWRASGYRIYILRVTAGYRAAQERLLLRIKKGQHAVDPLQAFFKNATGFRIFSRLIDDIDGAIEIDNSGITPELLALLHRSGHYVRLSQPLTTDTTPVDKLINDFLFHSPNNCAATIRDAVLRPLSAP